jgi:VWFA-related protein
MTRATSRAGAAALAAAFGVLLSAQAQQPPQPTRPDPQRPIFRADAHMVRVDAYPSRDGKIIEGLTAADFEILEDGKPQAIDNFQFIDFSVPMPETARRDPNSQRDGFNLAADPRYRVFVIYLDTYHVNVSGSYATRRPLVDFLNRMLGARDLFGVLTPQQIPMRDLLLGQQTLSIEEQLARRWTWGAQGSGERDEEELQLEACFPPPPTAPIGSVSELVGRRRFDKVFSDLDETIAILDGIREERKNIILFSRGWPLPGRRAPTAPIGGGIPKIDITNAGKLTLGKTGLAGDVNTNWCNDEASRLLDIDFQQRHRDMIQHARRANVTFYPVNPSGLEVSGGGGRVDRLMELADNTDGVAITNTNDLRVGLQRVADDLRAYYLLGYYTSNTKWDGSLRRITVRLKPSGDSVRARREYRAPTEAEMATLRNPPPSAVAAGPSPVDEALAAIKRMRPGAAVHTYARAAGSEIAVVAEIAAAGAEAGRWKSGGEIQVIVTAKSGDIVGTGRTRFEPGTRGALVRIATGPDQGPWTVVVRMRGEGEEPEEDQMAVERGTHAVLGDPLLFRGAPAPASPLRPVAGPHFRRTERVAIEWPLLTAIDRREARLLGRDGKPVPLEIALTERTSAGAPVLAADLNLAPLTAGDYVIEVTAGAGDKSERRMVAIRVVR